MKRTKNEVQLEARKAFKDAKHWGLIAMCTGAGKSKIGVDEAVEVATEKKDANIIVAVPTQKLRDKNWPEEFKKWKATRIWNKNVTKCCYVSLNKIKGQTIDLVVLDEGHNITILNSEFFENNTIKRCLFLTATPPNKDGSDRDKEKIEILKKWKVETIFNYPLDQGVREGVVADYEINVVECYLDNVVKYIPGGSKTKPFFQTEYGAYTYLSGVIRKLMYSGNSQMKFKILERMHLIKGLKSKKDVCKELLDTIIPKNEKYIIFCSSIKQANELMGNDVFHSESSDVSLNKFHKGTINRLGVVDALNEGHNIENVDGAIVNQVSSQKRKLIQQIGRAVRLREGHKATIWVLVTMGTVDEEWFKKAIEDFDTTKIVHHHFKNLSRLVAA